MSLQQDGNSNIYAMDLRSRATTRLTSTNAIDTSPSYSPDGSKVVFESDRGGRSQIYVMGADGSGQPASPSGRAPTTPRSGARAATSSPSPSRPAASSRSA